MKPLIILLIILLAIGAIQGIVFGLILYRNKGDSRIANKFLSFILFFFSYRLIVEILKFFDLGNYDLWYHIFLEFNWVYGAIMYFFVKANVSPNFKLKFKSDWIHFLPVFIEILWSIFIKSQNFFWDGTRESLSWLGYWGYVVWMHYPTMHIVSGALILFYTLKSERLLKQNPSEKIDLITKNIEWINHVLKVLRYFSLFFITIVLIDFFFFDYAFNRFYNYPVYIGMALITYWLGLVGFSKRNEVRFKEKKMLSETESQFLNEIIQKLNTLMTENKIFKNPDLNLTLLAEHLNIKPYLLTKYLNIELGKNFNDYINHLRIEELKNLLKDPKNSNFTLLSMAFEAGFNSKASFNRAVKKLTGKSPSHLKSNI